MLLSEGGEHNETFSDEAVYGIGADVDAHCARH
jgi:hypothetical protein